MMVAFAFIVVVVAIVHSRLWATQPLRLPDGRSFAVLDFEPHTSVSLAPDGTQTTEEMFWVRYYANYPEDSAAVIAEARNLAPALYAIADGLYLDIMRLSPSRPIFVRAFPLGVASRELRFERDSLGGWYEVGR